MFSVYCSYQMIPLEARDCYPYHCYSNMVLRVIFNLIDLFFNWRIIALQIFGQFSHWIMSDYVTPSQHARPPCLSPTPRVHPNPRPLSHWCHPTISFSVVPFSCRQSFPASESFPMSQLFASGGRSPGVSASTSVHPMNNQELISFRMDWLDLLAV